jgi:DNA recombination protein RmuC
VSTAAAVAAAFVALVSGAAIGMLAGFLLAQWRAARHLAQSDARLRATFDSVAGESLRANSELFLRMAREALSREHVIGESALKEREVAISQLIEPLRVALERTEAQVQGLERERRDAFASLRVQIETLAGGHAQLQRETRALVTALRRPEVRGRWGEITLRRVVELAGLAEHCDFTEQQHIAGQDGILRPDLVVHMPDGRDLVIDVKTPLDAYLEALEAPSDEGRQLALKRHAQQLETHVRQLASKAYWAQFQTSPEFAVLFLPGDQFLSAALAERPEIMDNALKQAVIIATPSTLIALLKSVAYGWRQSAVAHNAATIRDLGQELYRRLGNFTGHLGKVGQRLDGAVEAYNSAVGSLERQVLPQARRFTDLGVTADTALATLDPITQLARPATTAPSAEASREAAPHTVAPRTSGSHEL